MTTLERFNLRLYEKDGIQFRMAQVTISTTAQEITDSAKDKWFKGWPNITVCLGEQRGTGPVRPVEGGERPGEVLARYRGADEIKFYLVVRPINKASDRDVSPRSGKAEQEQRESPEAFQGLSRRLSVLRHSSFSNVKQPPRATTAGVSAAPVPTPFPISASPSANASPLAPPSNFYTVRPVPSAKTFPLTSSPQSIVSDTHAVYGTLVVAPLPTQTPMAPVRTPEQRKDTVTGLADIRSKIDMIRQRNEEEKRKIDLRMAEEQEEKRRAEELTRKFEEEIEAMRRGDAERKAAAAQSMSSFQKAARPPSERPTQQDSHVIGRRQIEYNSLRPLSAESGTPTKTSPLGNISRPPPPRPTNTSPLPPVIQAPPPQRGVRVAVRANLSPTPGSAQASGYSMAHSATTAQLSVGLPPPPIVPAHYRALGSPRRRSGSAPPLDLDSVVNSDKPRHQPPASPRSALSQGGNGVPIATPAVSITTTSTQPRPESPRSPRALSLLSGQHRLSNSGNSSDSSPSTGDANRLSQSTGGTNTNSRLNPPVSPRGALIKTPLPPDPQDMVEPQPELSMDESELLALEQEYEEMRVSQLPPATDSEMEAFVSLRFEDIVFIGTLAEGRLSPVRHAVYNGQEVVVKRIASSVPQEVLAERFGWLRNLRHVNIAPTIGILLQIMESESQPPGVYVVSEYQAGGTLRQLLNSSMLVLPWKLRLAMVADVAKAVHYMHLKGVTHGAIRSASALVDLNGRLRLSDVGLARRFSDAPRADDSRYAAPEALTNAVFSPQGDAFSFGVLLWEITHRRDAPFRRADDNYSAESLLEWPIPEGAMPELPLLLARCLAHEASDRPGFDDIVPRVRAMLVTAK